jgi:hypothetical protein
MWRPDWLSELDAERLADIEKRFEKAKAMVLTSPEHLRSGTGIDEVELKRIIKEQDNESKENKN